MRALLDTNVLVRAATRPASPARELLRYLRADPHRLVLSPFLLTELSRVLHYPRVREQAQLDDVDVRDFLDGLEEIAEVVDPGAVVVELSRDPDDNPILQAAATARVDVICTRDRDFEHPDVAAFCAAHGIRILNEVELLNELRAAGAADK